MRIFSTRKGSTAWMRHLIPRDRIWRLIDAKDQVLGRVAQQAAKILMGKHKPYWKEIDNINTGDPVVIVNARQFLLTGRKRTNHEYIHHSGYPGGLKRVPITDVMRRRPELPLKKAVYNMLPRNKLRTHWMLNLHIYLDDDHPHHVQKPIKVNLVHVPINIKIGRAPNQMQIHHWWGQNLARNCKDTNHVENLLSKAKQHSHALNLAHVQNKGLAELLHFNHTHDEIKSNQFSSYITAAERALKQPAVIQL